MLCELDYQEPYQALVPFLVLVGREMGHSGCMIPVSIGALGAQDMQVPDSLLGTSKCRFPTSKSKMVCN